MLVQFDHVERFAEMPATLAAKATEDVQITGRCAANV